MINRFLRLIVRYRRHRRSLAVLVAVVAASIEGCAATTHVPLRVAAILATATPAPIQLPADDIPHDTLTEWWYYTGHLAGPSAEKYGFEEVIFQVERQNIPPFYAAHFAITDRRRGEFRFDQRTWFRQVRPVTFDLGDGDWRISGNGSSDRLQARTADYAFDATFVPTKPPIRHGDNGVISFGPVGDSYYYSTTRATINGTIVDHGVTVPVTGEAWKDRQWGNFLVSPGGGWDWLSLQLSDRSEIMLFILRSADGAVAPSYGTLVQPDGTSRSLPPGAAQVTALGHWQSPHTGTVYPSGWSVVLPEQGLSLRAEPVVADQELDTTASTGTIYWEGEVVLTGASHGNPVTGRGYVELTGYAASRP